MIARWLRPVADPEAEAEAQRIRTERETVKTSQIGAGLFGGPGSMNLPPTPDVLDPKKR
jgi:hypothetical protein